MPTRRSFLGGVGAALAGATVLGPGRRTRSAWAAAGRTRRVVVVGIGGGLRTREVLGMAEGATMPNLFGTSRLVSGFGSGAPGLPRIAPEYAAMPGVLPLALPAVRARPLYTEGALITNLRYADGPPGHLQGHGCLVSGAYNTIENRADARLPAPTVFELHRKASNAPATDAWYLSVPGGFYRALVASDQGGYGAAYAATFLQPPGVMQPTLPLVTSGRRQVDIRQGVPTIPQDPAEDAAARRLTAILDGNSPGYARDDLFPHADPEDQQEIRGYLGEFYADGTYQSYFPQSFGIGLRQPDGDLQGTPDAQTVHHAERILDRFAPSLLVMSLLDVDTCHQDFNGYLRAQQIADAAVSHLWSFIQGHPMLRDETALIVLPEHGRHLFFNGLNPDSLGRSGLDHGQGDDGDRDVWMLALGPDVRAGVATAPTGVSQPGRTSGRYESIDAIMTAMTMIGHGDRMRTELTDRSMRPGLVVEEVMA